MVACICVFLMHLKPLIELTLFSLISWCSVMSPDTYSENLVLLVCPTDNVRQMGVARYRLLSLSLMV